MASPISGEAEVVAKDGGDEVEGEPVPPPHEGEPVPPPHEGEEEVIDGDGESMADREEEHGGDEAVVDEAGDDDGDSDDESMAEVRRANELTTHLSAAGDPSTQLVILTKLCDALAFTSDDSVFDHEVLQTAVPALLTLAQQEAFPDLMLLAIRSVTYVYSASPKLFDSHVEVLVEAVSAPLRAIEYLDLAEQCLQLLEKISRRQPLECLEAGVIMSVLKYIDFFSSSYQRIGIVIIENICKTLPSDSSSQILEAVPVLCNLLVYEDHKLVEKVVTCLTRIVKQARHSSEKLFELCKQGLIPQVVQLINLNSENFLRKPIYNGLVKLLSRLASGSITASNTLLELNISSTLKNILSTYNKPYSLVGTDAKYNQIHEVLELLNVLLPPLPTNSEDNMEVSDKERITTRHPETLQQFGADILPILVQVVYSGADVDVCYGCLLVMNKILYFSRSHMHQLLKDIDISSFLANILAQKDHHLLMLALRLVETVMQELADVFLDSFLKQGIVHAIVTLGTPEKCHSQKIAANDDAGCLCFLFNLNHPSSLETETCKLEETSVHTLAKHILTTYFATVSQDSELGLTRVLQKLRKLSAGLSNMVNTPVENDSCEQEKKLTHILGQIMEELNVEESVSTFEFIESGIMRSLVDYLSNGCYQNRKVDSRHLSNELNVLQKRFEVFARLCLSPTAHHWKDTPLAILIRKLQSALSSVENFPVILSCHNSSEIYALIPSERNTTLPCLKVHFTKKGEEEGLSDSIPDVVNIEAFTSLDTMERYMLDNFSISVSEQPASNASNENQRLRFYLDGELLDRALTLYQALLQLKMKAENDFTGGSSFWDQVHEVSYRRDTEQSQTNAQDVHHNSHISTVWNHPKILSHDALCFSRIFFDEVPYSCEKSSPTDAILILLKILDVMNKSTSLLVSYERTNAFVEGHENSLDSLMVTVCNVPQKEFVSLKLTEKLELQMHESSLVCTGSMPPWYVQLMEVFPFLFSFEARRKYFQMTLYGFSHVELQRRRQSVNNSSDRQLLASRLPRKRLKVCRSQILESAAQVIGSRDCSKAILEVEYPDEVGTGLGPTLEFYTLVSQEFQKVGLGMWREDQGDDENSGYIVAPLGLFPRPWSASACTSDKTDFSEVVNYFVLLGQVVAKALQDGRVLDLSLSVSFYKLILEQELNLYDIQSFDPGLGKTLIEFRALIDRYKVLCSVSGEHKPLITDSYFRDSRIEDLCLDFTLPGYPDYTLTSVHDHKMVNISNLEEYVSLTTDATVNTGISRQVEAFKSGFNKVFPLRSLQIFTPEELDQLLCGERKAWSSNELLDHIKFDHGYTASSPPIISLLEIMQEFEGNQQRAFVQFVTGAPRLPPGGLAALSPKLTVVRKHCNRFDNGDLPSVMTCANYLKLPPYSSKEIMRERVLYAITEGQGSFHLS